MPYHNFQQISDRLDELDKAGNKEAQDAGAFLVSQVQPLANRISALETAVAQLQADLKALKGA